MPRANLVAVITNGTAVLGLGNIGALAGKPVMEGKGCLFKKFAGIDVFDIEINESDPDKIVEVVAALEPTFGGINLEDIKAPGCFYIEKKLRERMKIPVFHDDQHGTAIVAAAAVLNGLKIVGKDIKNVKLVCSGAGAAALACLNLQVSLGLDRANIFVTDSNGVVYKGRKQVMDPDREAYAQDTKARTLDDIIGGADIFLGLSAGGVLTQAMVKKMADKPIILAMANPEPEIRPELAKAARPDCLIGTGRSDYPNQVNNSLCFPFIFRGALDCGASTINEEMKLAAVRGLAELARAEPSEIVALAYGEQTPPFGPDYLIPRAFDPRLITNLAPAVAKAAMDSGVASRPIKDFDAYREKLSHFVYQSGTPMGPVFEAARQAPKRVVYAEAEDERVLRAAQVALDEGIARPVLVGRTDIITARIQKLGLRLKLDDNCDGVNILDDERYREVGLEYYQIARRKGVSRDQAMEEMRSRPTLIGAMLVRRGDADAMLCGTRGNYADHLKYVRNVIGLREGVKTLAAMQMLILPGRQLFVCDTHVKSRPHRRGGRRNHAPRRRGSAALRSEAECRAVVALEFRQLGCAVGAKNARRAGAHRSQGAGPRCRRRNARGLGAIQDHTRSKVSRLWSRRRRQSAGHAQRRRREHYLQRAAGDVRGRHHRRRHPAGRRQAGAHHDAIVHGAAHRQHDSSRGGRRRGAAREAVKARLTPARRIRNERDNSHRR